MNGIDQSDVPAGARATPLAEPGAAAGRHVLRGATAIIPQELIGDGEVVVLALKPSLWFILLVSLRWLVAAGAVVAFGCYFREWLGWRLAERVVQAALLAAAVRLLIGSLQWLGRVYVLTDRRIMRLKGVLHIDLFQCLLGKLQQVELALPLSERVLLCGTVLFFTAGTDTADAAWQTVSRPGQVYRTILETIGRYHGPNGQP